MAWNKEKDLQLKYQYIPDEPVPHKKKKGKKKVKKSNHKHNYIPCYYWGYNIFDKSTPHLYEGSYCSECGKVGSFVWAYLVSTDSRDKLTKITEAVKLHQPVDKPVIYLPENFDCFKDKFIPLS